jgi:hypothetical protein
VLLSLFVIASLSAPDPGQPITPVPLPKGLDSAPWSALEVPDCKARLLATGLSGKNFRFSKNTWIASRKPRGQSPFYCHIPQNTVTWSGTTGLQYLGFTSTTCAMALAMTRMEQVLQEEARRIFGHPPEVNPVRWVSHLGTFNCRLMRQKTRQSQHSFGNGLDLAGFWVKGFGEIHVSRHWKPIYPSWQRPSDFLKAVSRRLRDEHIFTNVLDPDSDPGHWNHIHVDLAPESDGAPSPALGATMTMPTGASEPSPPPPGSP